MLGAQDLPCTRLAMVSILARSQDADTRIVAITGLPPCWSALTVRRPAPLATARRRADTSVRSKEFMVRSLGRGGSVPL